MNENDLNKDTEIEPHKEESKKQPEKVVTTQMVSKKKSVWEIHETQGKEGLTKKYKSILMSQSASNMSLSYSHLNAN